MLTLPRVPVGCILKTGASSNLSAQSSSIGFSDEEIEALRIERLPISGLRYVSNSPARRLLPRTPLKMVWTKLQYLARDDRYRVEKPYSADFNVDHLADGASKSNLVTTTSDVDVKPIADRGNFDINVNGFCILKAKTSLTAEEALTKPETAEPMYQAEVEVILRNHFPEYERFEPLDFVVSRFLELVLTLLLT